MTKKYKMTTEIPDFITTPDKVETRLGRLEFFDGYPSHDTVQKCYDNLLFMRGVEVFLNWMPGASMFALREGFRTAGITRNGIIGIYEELMDSKPLFLTGLMAFELEEAGCGGHGIGPHEDFSGSGQIRQYRCPIDRIADQIVPVLFQIRCSGDHQTGGDPRMHGQGRRQSLFEPLGHCGYGIVNFHGRPDD